MTGAQVFARACKEEGVAALFACPGNYPVIHAIAVDRHSRLRRAPRRLDGARGRRVHPRHRRDRGRRPAPKGPGFTDMICAIACANAARTPLLVVASNMSIGAGRHRGRHSARLPAADHRRAEEVRQAADHPAARARVRRLRVPAAAAAACRSRCTSTSPPRSRPRRFKDATELEFFHDKARYRTDSRPHPSPKDIASGGRHDSQGRSGR